MAATGKTPILLYGSTTASNVPVAGNLTNSSDGCEIAINVADKNLFFKDSTNTVNTVPIRQSSASSNGWLSSTDWSTFNGKAPAFTYTTGYIPFGQGTTTPTQSANLFFDGTNLGVGVVTPQNKIQVTATDTSNSIGASTAAINICNFSTAAFGRSSNLIFSLGGGTTAESLSAITSIYTNYSSSIGGALAFSTNNGSSSFAERMRLHSSGGVSIGNTTDPGAKNLSVTGNVVIATSGKGIDFSATAGTGTSELLADYEEGTWTPVVVGTTSAGTGTYTVQQAHYIKTGNVVNFTCALGWSNHTGTGNIEITGLPYSISGSQDTAPCSVYCWGLTFTGQLTAVTSGTKISPYQIATGAAATALAMDTAVAAFNISGFYFTN